MTAKLVVIAGPNPGAEYHLLTDRITLGRAEDADVVLFDRAISRHHIEVFRDGVGYSVRDLDSGNGTFLNGSRIREAELISGDRIELGGHTLEFQESVPSRDPRERQVVYRLDKGAPKPAPPPGPAPAPPPSGGKLHIKVPPKQVVATPGIPQPAHRAKKSSGLLIALVFVFGIVFLGLAAFIGYRLYQNRGPAPPNPAQVAAHEIELGNAALAQAEQAASQAQGAQPNWDAARDHFNAALHAQPDNQQASDGLNRTAVEARQASLLQEAERHISVGEYVQAIVNLRTVAGESQFFSNAAQDRLTRLFDELVAVGRSHIDRGEVDLAESFANVVLDAQPDHRGALALRDEVQLLRAQQAQVAAAQTPAAPGGTTTPSPTATTTDQTPSPTADRGSHDDHSHHDRETPAPARPSDHGGSTSPSSSSHDSGSDPLARGWRDYAAGNFDQAEQFFRDYAGRNSGDLASQASDYADRVHDFSEAYQSGLQDYNTGDYAVAVHDLRRAYSLDRRLQETYKDRLSNMLADSYYHMAQANYDSGDYRDAGENAQIALRYVDNHAETQNLVHQLEQQANSLYIQAVSYRESNPERAAQICRDIEAMLPEGNDLRQRAEALRNGL